MNCSGDWVNKVSMVESLQENHQTRGKDQETQLAHITPVEICPWSDEYKFKIFGSNDRIFVEHRENQQVLSGYVVPTRKHGRGGVMEGVRVLCC